jgi:hypothetical protein
MLAVGTIAALAMSWVDINDPEFIKNTINPPVAETDHPIIAKVAEFEHLKSQLEQTQTLTDYSESAVILTKIASALRDLPEELYYSIKFIENEIIKTIDRLTKLIKQEEYLVSYLDKNPEQEIVAELGKYQDLYNTVKDAIAKTQYKKAIALKKGELQLRQELELKLQRINSYIHGVQSILDNTYTNIAKFRLQEIPGDIDNGEILVESMKQVITDLESYEEKLLPLEMEINIEETAEKSSTKQTDTQIN